MSSQHSPIEKIVVHERVRSEGCVTQKMELVCKGIGKIDPEDLSL